MELGRVNEMERNSKETTISRSTKECQRKSGNEKNLRLVERVCEREGATATKTKKSRCRGSAVLSLPLPAEQGAPPGQAFG